MSVKCDFFSGVILAIRSRYFVFVFVSVFFVALSSVLSGLFGGREPIATMLDVGISTIRLVVPLLIILLAQDLFFREFDKRYYFSSMTYPRSRFEMLMGRLLSLFFLVYFFLLVLVLALWGVVFLFESFYGAAGPVSLGSEYFFFFLFFSFEVLVVSIFATFLSLVASSQGFVLIGGIGFVLVARSYSSVIELLRGQAGVSNHAAIYNDGLIGLSFLIPDFGALDVRGISLYSDYSLLPEGIGIVVLSCLFYAFSLFALLGVVVQRKRFS